MDDRKFELKQAVLTKDVSALLQVYAEGVDFLDPLPDIVSQQRGSDHVTSSSRDLEFYRSKSTRIVHCAQFK